MNKVLYVIKLECFHQFIDFFWTSILKKFLKQESMSIQKTTLLLAIAIPV